TGRSGPRGARRARPPCGESASSPCARASASGGAAARARAARAGARRRRRGSTDTVSSGYATPFPATASPRSSSRSCWSGDPSARRSGHACRPAAPPTPGLATPARAPARSCRPRAVDHLGIERVDRGRERVREPFDLAAVRQDQPALLRQADVRLDLTALHLDAVGCERPLDVVERLRLAGAPRLALEGADRVHVLHERGGRHVLAQRLLQRIAVLPTRGRRHERPPCAATSSSTLAQLIARWPA